MSARSKGRTSATPIARARSRAASAQPELAHDAIAREAYRIWEQHGRPGGQELLHWLEAEQRLRSSPQA
jgi:hypothetical protein